MQKIRAVSVEAATETLTKPDNSTIAHTSSFGYDSLSQLTAANISNISGSTWVGSYILIAIEFCLLK
ncbi:MAG: hypothetical protein LLF92_10580 [Planctomycetaceae bacterium]|nr:hypothetical protein [Planctomycetaceae bacterium]